MFKVKTDLLIMFIIIYYFNKVACSLPEPRFISLHNDVIANNLKVLVKKEISIMLLRNGY